MSQRSHVALRICRQAPALAACAVALIALATSAAAQTYTYSVLAAYNTSALSGSPFSGLISDASGNLYGTTYSGDGSVYELVNHAGAYTGQTLYSFTGSTDGAGPRAGLVMDAAGDLFGVAQGGGASGAGTVYELQNNGGSYSFLLLFTFNNTNGSSPIGTLAMDQAGNLFGTTQGGGPSDDGTVFELANGGGGTYTYELLYAFTGSSDGRLPLAGVVLDANGNLFGTTSQGGAHSGGTVYKLANNGNGSYSLQTIYSFNGLYGAAPEAGVTLDASGDVFGTATGGDAYHYGMVYELMHSGQVYFEKTLHTFTGTNGDGGLPRASVLVDAHGDIFGTTDAGGSANDGTVYELVNSSGVYTEQILHSFAGGSDGEHPLAGILMDAYGNLYGTFEALGNSVNGGAWMLAAPASTSLQLTSSTNPAAEGNNITFTATVTPTPSVAPVSGTVTFSAGANVLGTAAVSGNQASLTVAGSAVGLGTTQVSAQFTSSNPQQLGSSASIQQVVTDFAATDASNTFSGDQTVIGTMTATSFAGNGAGLTNVTAAALSCAKCINNTQLAVNYAGSATIQGGPAANSLLLGGLPAADFATLLSNSFTGDQTINGNLTVAGNVNGAQGVFSGNVRAAMLTASGPVAGGSLTIGGGTAISEYISVTDTITLPAIKGGSCTTFQTAALTNFTPGTTDTLSLGIPSQLIAGLTSQPPGPKAGKGHPPAAGQPVYLSYQAWETGTGPSPTVTLQVCNLSGPYAGGATGTIRVDVFKH
jgi:uncharacterized repeat protein (TIGR03803 family)